MAQRAVGVVTRTSLRFFDPEELEFLDDVFEQLCEEDRISPNDLEARQRLAAIVLGVFDPRRDPQRIQDSIAAAAVRKN